MRVGDFLLNTRTLLIVDGKNNLLAFLLIVGNSMWIHAEKWLDISLVEKLVYYLSASCPISVVVNDNIPSGRHLVIELI